MLALLLGLGLLLLLSRTFREHAFAWLVRLAVAGVALVFVVSWLASVLAEHVTAVLLVATFVLGTPGYLHYRRHRQALERLFPPTPTSQKKRRPDA